MTDVTNVATLLTAVGIVGVSDEHLLVLRVREP